MSDTMTQNAQKETKVKLTKKQNLIQTLKFVIFSATAGVIQTVTFTLMNELGHLPYWPSYLTALILSVLYNFTVNRKFTFKSANNVPLAMLKVAAYYAVFTPASTLWGKALTDIGWNEYLVLFLTMFINLTTEFLFNRFVVYRNSINTNTYARKEKEINAIGKLIFAKQITPNPCRERVLDEFAASAPKGGIVFAGDSIIENFAANEYFAEHKVYNRGISDDTSNGLLLRCEKHFVEQMPSKVFLMIGANDIAQGREVATIVDNIKKVICLLKDRVPSTKIFILSVLPANNRIAFHRRNETAKALNHLLKNLDQDGAKYLELYDAFADAQGNLKPEYTYDGLHLGHNGYKKLAALLLPYLQ